jgi:hypothetical protein
MASLSLPPALRSRQGLAALALILGSLFLLYSHASNTSARHQLQTIQATDELRPIKGRFPSWYGNPDVVGFSPWDFDGSEAAKWDGKAGGRKKRVLFLTGKLISERRGRKGKTQADFVCLYSRTLSQTIQVRSFLFVVICLCNNANYDLSTAPDYLERMEYVACVRTSPLLVFLLFPWTGS